MAVLDILCYALRSIVQCRPALQLVMSSVATVYNCNKTTELGHPTLYRMPPIIVLDIIL